MQQSSLVRQICRLANAKLCHIISAWKPCCPGLLGQSGCPKSTEATRARRDRMHCSCCRLLLGATDAGSRCGTAHRAVEWRQEQLQAADTSHICISPVARSHTSLAVNAVWLEGPPSNLRRLSSAQRTCPQECPLGRERSLQLSGPVATESSFAQRGDLCLSLSLLVTKSCSAVCYKLSCCLAKR